MGLKAGDLEDLVVPCVSIDEYESKIDDDAVVVAIYVRFDDPARDLNKFIQKTAYDIIDTDISPSVTEEGDFVVFIEMYRNYDLPDILDQILYNIGKLANIDKWDFTCYGEEGEFELNEDNIIRYVRLTDEETDDVIEFFINSSIDDLILEDSSIILEKGNNRISLDMVSITYVDTILEGFSEDFETNTRCRFLESILGGGYIVQKNGQYYTMFNGKMCLKVRE